jgi:hypothetical protein
MPKARKNPLGPTPLKRVTMRDIAEAAGVHVMTVSNTLSGTRFVAPET